MNIFTKKRHYFLNRKCCTFLHHRVSNISNLTSFIFWNTHSNTIKITINKTQNHLGECRAWSQTESSDLDLPMSLETLAARAASMMVPHRRLCAVGFRLWAGPSGGGAASLRLDWEVRKRAPKRADSDPCGAPPPPCSWWKDMRNSSTGAKEPLGAMLKPFMSRRSFCRFFLPPPPPANNVTYQYTVL